MRVDDHALLPDGGLVEYQVEPGTGCVQVKDYRDPRSMRYQNRAAGERAFERQRLALRLSWVVALDAEERREQCGSGGPCGVGAFFA